MHYLTPYVHIHVTWLEVDFHILPHIKAIIYLLEISHRKNVASFVITGLLWQQILLRLIYANLPVLSETSIRVL